MPFGRGAMKKFQVRGCPNCFAQDIRCKMAICRFCINGIMKELERGEDETDEGYAKRKMAKETEWCWKELNDGTTAVKCEQRLSHLKMWDNVKEVGRMRRGYELVAQYCIECGGEL